MQPEMRLSWFSEKSESYVDSKGKAIPSIAVNTGTLKFGPTIARSFTLPNEMTVSPYVRAQGIWTFAQENSAAAISGLDGLEQKGLRAKLEGGLNLQLSESASFDGSMFYDGIGMRSYEAYGASVGLRIRF